MSDAEVRRFQGPGFAVMLPTEWRDQSVYAASRAIAGRPGPRLTVGVDRDAPEIDLAVFSIAQVERRRAELPACTLLGSRDGAASGGAPYLRFELRWQQEGQDPRYEAVHCAVLEGVGFTLAASFSKKELATCGPGFDRMAASLSVAPQNDRSLGLRTARAGQLVGSGFQVSLETGWIDETMHVFEEPCSAPVKRSALVQRTPLDDQFTPVAEVLGDRLAAIAGSPEVELLGVESERTEKNEVVRISYRSKASPQKPLLQWQTFFVEGPQLFALTLTSGDDCDAAARQELDNIASSFSPLAGSQTKAPGGRGA